MGAFADTLERYYVLIPYSDIPGWPQSRAVGHAGKLVVGAIDGFPIAVLAGRARLSMRATRRSRWSTGSRTLASCGIESIILTNAAGGVNLSYGPGQLVLISDHINLLGQNPLTGPNDESLGPRFPEHEPGLFETRFRQDRTGGGQ